jgi:hypothetical protein
VHGLVVVAVVGTEGDDEANDVGQEKICLVQVEDVVEGASVSAMNVASELVMTDEEVVE